MSLIPHEYQNFWEAVDIAPAQLIHQTPQSFAQQISVTGFIQPRKPLNGLWTKVTAAFLSDINDKTFEARNKGSLKAHFDCSREPLAVFPVEPIDQIFRCTIPERRSDYISLTPVPILLCPYQAIAC